MRLMRFARISIAGLAGAIALCAVGLACLKSASTAWAGAVFSTTLGLLALAPLGIIYRRGERRAFWIGAALCGWSYMLFSSGPWFVENVQHRLVTTRLLKWAYPWVISEDRRSSNPRFAGRDFSIESPILQDGLTIQELGWTSVDVWTKGGAEAKPSLLLEGVEACPVLELSTGGHSMRLMPAADDQLAALERAKAEHRMFYLRLHRAGALDVFGSSPPVSPYAFEAVGHPLFGLLCAWIGGVAGRAFFATRGPDEDAAGVG